jgi:hypothetical protein
MTNATSARYRANGCGNCSGTVTITDTTLGTTTTIPFNVTSAAVSLTVDSNTVAYGSSVNYYITGGKAPSISISPTQSSGTLSVGSTSGSYTANGVFESVTITVSDSGASVSQQLNITDVPLNVFFGALPNSVPYLYYNEQVTYTVMGGVPAYTVSGSTSTMGSWTYWGLGSSQTTSLTLSPPCTSCTLQLTVTDYNNVNSATASIAIGGQAPAVSVGNTTLNPGDSTTITITEGSGSYSLQLSNYAGTLNSTFGSVDSTTRTYVGTFTAASPGTVDLSVLDSNSLAGATPVTITINHIYGCTDSTANNYNSSATASDNSCTYTIYGCTNSGASNYNSSATQDDGSCTFPIGGCMDPNASNYNSSATYDDSSCSY